MTPCAPIFFYSRMRLWDANATQFLTYVQRGLDTVWSTLSVEFYSIMKKRGEKDTPKRRTDLFIVREEKYPWLWNKQQLRVFLAALARSEDNVILWYPRVNLVLRTMISGWFVFFSILHPMCCRPSPKSMKGKKIIVGVFIICVWKAYLKHCFCLLCV